MRLREARIGPLGRRFNQNSIFVEICSRYLICILLTHVIARSVQGEAIFTCRPRSGSVPLGTIAIATTSQYNNRLESLSDELFRSRVLLAVPTISVTTSAIFPTRRWPLSNVSIAK